MTRSRGRSPRGERLVTPVPFGRWQTSTLIHAIGYQATRASTVFEGATNTEVFETFVEKLLVPELKGNEIVILDNLSSHKGEKVNDMVTATGAELRFLPPYSPDLNPIEIIFLQTQILPASSWNPNSKTALGRSRRGTQNDPTLRLHKLLHRMRIPCYMKYKSALMNLEFTRELWFPV